MYLRFYILPVLTGSIIFLHHVPYSMETWRWKILWTGGIHGGVHLEDHEDLSLSSYNYRKWIQDPWKPNTLLLQGDSMVTSQMVEKWIPLNILFNWFLHTPDVQEIIFYTICDVTIESLCNNSVLGYQWSWIHFW